MVMYANKFQTKEKQKLTQIKKRTATYTCRNFGPCVAQVEKVREGIDSGGRQKRKCSLGPSALFTGANNYLQ